MSKKYERKIFDEPEWFQKESEELLERYSREDPNGEGDLAEFLLKNGSPEYVKLLKSA